MLTIWTIGLLTFILDPGNGLSTLMVNRIEEPCSIRNNTSNCLMRNQRKNSKYNKGIDFNQQSQGNIAKGNRREQQQSDQNDCQQCYNIMNVDSRDLIGLTFPMRHLR
ncbi:hypothetical protein GWI33_020522 [Rhynchophorus ferrugineus]|uniref:Secreted protein n=1 Tax=Rhynchophorus ferrugineus TaxID=354439 RepID=A0A834HSB3_RHYFE|nr:hypothetical protein GWI33_020522 [Rhynchophorus ferrugineus]